MSMCARMVVVFWSSTSIIRSQLIGGEDTLPYIRIKILHSPAVVDNLPKVPEEKLEKLMGVIERIFGQVGTIKDGEH